VRGREKVSNGKEEVVQTFLGPTFHLAACDHNAAIRETLLFAYLVVRPSRRIKLGQNVPSASVRFGEKNHFYWCLLLGRDNTRLPDIGAQLHSRQGCRALSLNNPEILTGLLAGGPLPF
jgi:hypothetical protein